MIFIKRFFLVNLYAYKDLKNSEIHTFVYKSQDN